jgi:hypothetical protein
VQGVSFLILWVFAEAVLFFLVAEFNEQLHVGIQQVVPCEDLDGGADPETVAAVW